MNDQERSIESARLPDECASILELDRRGRERLLHLPSSGELHLEILRAAVELSGATSAALLWEDEEEPWHHHEHYDGRLTRETIQIGDERVVVEESLIERPFVVTESGATISRDGSRLIREAPSKKPFATLDGPASFLRCPLRGSRFRGDLFLYGIELDLPDLFARGETIGHLVLEQLDRELEHRRVREEAIREERGRVARDLHDGLLQAFTGVVLHLETLHQILENESEKARSLITDIEAVLMHEQRELRTYLENLSPRERGTEGEFDADARFSELIRRFSQQWNVDVEIDRQNVDPFVMQALGWETYRLIVEAITNAAKHGDARRIVVWLSTAEDRLQITVRDDGKGFAWRGRMPFDQLVKEHTGPGTIGERVASLNGQLWVDSTDDGSTIEITIPMGWKRD